MRETKNNKEPRLASKFLSSSRKIYGNRWNDIQSLPPRTDETRAREHIRQKEGRSGDKSILLKKGQEAD